MKKIVLSIIFVLILATSIVKNSTKEIEDEIFALNENIRSLKAEVGDLMWNWVRVFEREEIVRLLFFLFPPPP